jgi:hypothetical protein
VYIVAPLVVLSRAYREQTYIYQGVYMIDGGGVDIFIPPGYQRIVETEPPTAIDVLRELFFLVFKFFRVLFPVRGCVYPMYRPGRKMLTY